MAIASDLSLESLLAAARDGGRRADRRAVCRPRRHRSQRPAARALRHHRDRRRDAPRDRRPAARPGNPRRAHQRGDAAPAARPHATIRARSGSRRTIRRCSTFLGVPILLRGVAYGNFYLTEKADGETSPTEDQEIVSLLAAQAAVAIENARLYEASTQWSRQLESLNEVGNALATETDLGRCSISSHGGCGSCSTPALVACAAGGRCRAAVRGGRGRGGDGFRRPTTGARLLEERPRLRARSQRASDAVLDDPEVDHDVVRGLGARTGLWVPLVVRSATIGLIAVHDKLGPDPRFTDNDVRLAETFASRAAVAVDLSQRIARDALRRIVDAQELERRRLARELHDETGQALSSILLGLKALEERGRARCARGRRRRARARRATLHDVRRLAVELRPKVLDDFGLVPALERLTEGFARADGMRSLRAAWRRAASGRGRDRALPARAGVADEHRQTFARAERQRRPRSEDGGVVAVMVEDDGRGFDPAPSRDDGFGLQGCASASAVRRPARRRVGEGRRDHRGCRGAGGRA